MSQPDIIVSTSTDFAVTRRGRPVAPARWDDVVRVRAYTRHTAAQICLDVDLAGGVVVSVDDDSPGWEDLISDLEAQLPGALSSRACLAELAQPGAAHDEILVFERSADR